MSQYLMAQVDIDSYGPLWLIETATKGQLLSLQH